jgi:hypothetical protein
MTIGGFELLWMGLGRDAGWSPQRQCRRPLFANISARSVFRSHPEGELGDLDDDRLRSLATAYPDAYRGQRAMADADRR